MIGTSRVVRPRLVSPHLISSKLEERREPIVQVFQISRWLPILFVHADHFEDPDLDLRFGDDPIPIHQPGRAQKQFEFRFVTLKLGSYRGEGLGIFLPGCSTHEAELPVLSFAHRSKIILDKREPAGSVGPW